MSTLFAEVTVLDPPTRVGEAVPQTLVRRLTPDEMRALQQRAGAEGVAVQLGPDPTHAHQPEAGQ